MEKICYKVDYRKMERENYKSPISFYRVRQDGGYYIIEEIEGKYWRYGGEYKGVPLEDGEVIDSKRVRANNKELLELLKNEWNGNPVVENG